MRVLVNFVPLPNMCVGSVGCRGEAIAYYTYATSCSQNTPNASPILGVVDARGTSQECPECKGEVKKDLSVRVHDCPHCGYKTDRDVASGQVIRNRGIKLIGTDGLSGKETACAAELPGVEVTQSRQVAQSPRGITRKSSK
ncbi:MAG: zinc ribbon domain-containing protein [Coleofasciculus sp. G3-WIS-01]